MRVAILTRVSTAEQAEANRLSLEAQERAMRQKCNRQGWTIVAAFAAPGESAWTDDLAARPVLSRALDAAEAGGFEALMVYDVSRFARDQSLGHQTARRLKRAGVQLLDALTDADYTHEQLWFGINLAMAQQSSDLQSQKIKSAKAQRYELGLHNGDVPFGYRKGETTRDPLLPVPEEAGAIREAFRMRTSGSGYREIANWLNAQGFRPHSKVGHAVFGFEAVRAIVLNPFYYGVLRRGKESKLGAHEPVITESTWLRAQSMVRRQRGRRRPKTVRALLTGIARCAECRYPLHITHGARSAYYRERSEDLGRECSAYRSSWRAETPDAEVAAMMSELMTDRDWQATVRAVKISPVASTQRAALDAKRKRIIRLVVNGLIEETEAQGLLTDVNREIADLPLDVSPLKPALNRLQSFGEAWDAANMEQRNKLCAEMFSEVVLDTVSKDETGIVVKPHTELMPLFASRREYVLAYVGPAGFEPATNRL